MSDDRPPSKTQRPTESDVGGSHDSGDPPARKRLGDFDLLREIGRGGMGVVYEARQISLNRRVALKVLPPGLGLTPQAVQRFEREAHAAAKLHHTNIVPVYATGQDDGCHYYAMELIEGQPLSDVLQDLSGTGSNPLMDKTVTRFGEGEEERVESKPETSQATSGITSLSDTQSGGRKWFDAVATLIAEVADALEYAHGRGVIHRDIKPANLMLSSDGKLCITDFGLARVAQEPGMTVSGSLMGTPAYMSPEQIASGRMNLDHRTDVYSLGAVLYEMLTHRRPFPGDNREQILGGILTKDPRPPRRFNPRIPVDLETICLKAMEKDPDKRYATAGELANDLRQYLQHGLITARRAGVAKRTWKSIRRHPLAATVTVGVVVVALLVAFSWSALRQADVPHLVSEANLALERGEYRAGLEAAERALELQPGMPEARIVRARLLLQLLRFDEVIAEARAILGDNPDDWAAHFILAYVSKTGTTSASGGRPTISAAEHIAVVERLAPDSADLHFLRGKMAKSSSEAVEHYSRALELNPAHRWALVERLHKYANLRDFVAAKADAERLLAVSPRAADGRQNLGCVYRRQLEFEKSEVEFAKAIELDPDDPETYWERASLYTDMGRHEDSIEDLTRAIEIGPAREKFYEGRAWSYLRTGREEDAIADARKALDLNPDLRAAFHVLLLVYQNLDRSDEFERTADELRTRAAGWIDSEARADAYRRLAWLYHSTGDHEQALVEADRAVEADPQSLGARIQRTKVLRELNDEDGFEAECDALAALELVDPGPLETRARELGWTCLRWEQAVGHLSSIITDYPAWAYPYFNRGAAYYFLGRYEESLTDLTRADELAPGNSGTIGNRAVVYGKLHRYEEQLAEYDRALELDPRNTVVLGNLGEISLLLGRTDEALELHERALEIDPLYVWSRMNRAGVLALLDRCPEAVEEMRAAEDLLDRTNRFLITSVHSVFFWKCPADHDPAKALASARESVEAQPEDQQLIVAFAEALYREKRYGEAREAFLRADEMSDPDAHRLFFLAMSSWQLGDKTKARAYFDRGLAWMEDYAPKSPRLVLLREEASRLLGIRS